MRIFGIDPGTRVLGYGVVDDGKRSTLVCAGVVSASRGLPLPQRLRLLRDGLRARIEETDPDVIVLEKAFHGRNVASLIAMGEGRGVALLMAADHGVPIFEYAPTEVKKSVTGRGAARKEQVADMVRSILGDPEIAGGLDATDALAVALCHAQRRHLVGRGESELAGPLAEALRSSGGRARRGRRR